MALTTYSHDADDRVTKIIDHNSSGGILANFTYAYDKGSRLTTETADGSTRTFQ